MEQQDRTQVSGDDGRGLRVHGDCGLQRVDQSRARDKGHLALEQNNSKQPQGEAREQERWAGFPGSRARCVFRKMGLPRGCRVQTLTL